jgi:uncharacterized Ntn-hydrolase superfamily protein
MTFSISARCPRTGMFGVSVSSSSPCVAARCAHARAGVGAVATQNVTDPTLGPRGLDIMAGGMPAPVALERLKRDASHLQFRQLALVDRKGMTASFSGERTLGRHRAVEAPNVVAAGNALANMDVPERMVEAFSQNEAADLGDRLIAAMRAAVAAGGEEGPVHSAGLILVRDVPWPVADLRVDWHETDPIGALADLWDLWKPQLEAYVTRALDPESAPSYGVPGAM